MKRKYILKLVKKIAIVLILIHIFYFNNENAFGCIVFGLGDLEKKLCRSKICPNYGECRIDDTSGNSAKCYCPKECQENQFDPLLVSIANDEHVSVEIDKTVCGTDGKDYKSKCELERESCLQNREVKVAFTGKCSN